eukprot:TRINITY_DN4929_c0_g1_i1.p1 TRINITY_DN4929_c0_g1~~TRINITY_DN4929_c0_g1_i1.p1  ORF type:complete len:234 (+),score=29.25 TRINITY_DN4929_c0_g1_i1:325-1026(+)
MGFSLSQLRFIQEFEWKVGVTPLSSGVEVPIIAGASYLAVIFLLQLYMKNREPIKLKEFAPIHNMFLCIASMVMFVSIVNEMVPFTYHNGIYQAVCDPKRVHSSKGPVVFWLYVFYLSKIYEFLDTILQVLRKKSLQFLHVYHHVTTFYLCWIGMEHQVPYQWLDAALNAGVHIVMYHFYYMSEQGKTVWWKKYITKMQIVQFITDLFFHIYWMVAKARYPEDCQGTWLSSNV